MTLTEDLNRIALDMARTAAMEESELVAALRAVPFCDDDCRAAYAADLRSGLVAGVAAGSARCPGCLADLTESGEYEIHAG